MSTGVSLALLVKQCELLAEVTRTPYNQPLSTDLWSRCSAARAELLSVVQPLLFEQQVAIAMSRGPEIARDMGVRLPGADA